MYPRFVKMSPPILANSTIHALKVEPRLLETPGIYSQIHTPRPFIRHLFRNLRSISNSHDPFISAEKKGTTASDKSGKDDRRDSKNHLSGRLFHVPHLFLHPLQRHLVDRHQRHTRVRREFHR